MRHLAVLIAVAAAVHAPAGAEAEPPPPDPHAVLDPIARSLIDGQQSSGLVIALVSEAGPPKILAWGETVRGNGKLPDGNTVFEIGSVTKVFTSLLLAELVVDHQLTLDTPVATLLPGAKLPTGKRGITVLDLATHTSGLPRMPNNIHPIDGHTPYADYTTTDLLAFVATAVVAQEPGTHFEYSNLGAALLGEALARHGHAPWERLVREQITGPLAMPSTMVTLSPDAQARLAQGYDLSGAPSAPWEMPAFLGAGALRSTAADMAVFVKAELAASHRATSRLARAMALTQAPQRNIGDGSVGKIGLGWHIKSDGLRWHNGQTGTFHSYVAFQPAHGLGVVVLANGASTYFDDLGEAAIAAILGQPIPAMSKLPAPDVPVDGKILDSYVGAYELNPSFVITISRDGQSLSAQATGQPPFRMHATSEREFAVYVLRASLSFEVDARGKVTAMVLHQGGKDQRAIRK